MRCSKILLRHVQSIKFVGGPHVHSAIDAASKPHVASGGLIPGGEGTLQISALNWPKLVIVAPPKKAAAAPASAPAPSSNALKPSDKPFEYTSISQLPKKYQNAKFEDWEMDAVNGGGAGLLI